MSCAQSSEKRYSVESHVISLNCIPTSLPPSPKKSQIIIWQFLTSVRPIIFSNLENTLELITAQEELTLVFLSKSNSQIESTSVLMSHRLLHILSVCACVVVINKTQHKGAHICSTQPLGCPTAV